MIDYPAQELDRIEVPGVPDDIRYLGKSLDAIAHWTKKLYDAMRRQESPNPTIINLNPSFTFRTSTRMRSTALVFSGGTAGETFSLTAGRGSIYDWIVPASPAPFTLPFPAVLDAGIDYTVASETTPAAVNWRCRVIAYVELEDGNA
jgi:hypothetical protein